MDKIQKTNKILRSINDNEFISDKRSEQMYNMLMAYSLNVLDQKNDFGEKSYIITKANEFLSKIYSSIENKSEYILGNHDLMKYVERFGNNTTLEYVDRIRQIDKLRELGVNINDNNSISFIDASNEEKNNGFRNELESIKGENADKEITAKDFAMVRTTEYFPKDREMEIIDDLNSRIFRSNFLSDFLVSNDMKEKYGEGYLDYMLSNDDEDSEKNNMIQYRDSLEERYNTLTTIYRSTKHFTLNGLVSSHEYGDFAGNPYIIIDPLEEHIENDNIRSINEADTYFEITREEPMKLSKRAELMMPVEEYIRIQDNPERLKEISEYKLTLFSGDEKTAVDMKLKLMGYIPENIGKWGYEYEGYGEVMNDAICKLSKEYNIPIEVHYNSEFKKKDLEKTIEMQNKSNQEFVKYIFEKCNIDGRYMEKAIEEKLSKEELTEIVNNVGKDNIIQSIEKFNDLTRKRLDKKRDDFDLKRKKLHDNRKNNIEIE